MADDEAPPIEEIFSVMGASAGGSDGVGLIDLADAFDVMALTRYGSAVSVEETRDALGLSNERFTAALHWLGANMDQAGGDGDKVAAQAAAVTAALVELGPMTISDLAQAAEVPIGDMEAVVEFFQETGLGATVSEPHGNEGLARP